MFGSSMSDQQKASSELAFELLTLAVVMVLLHLCSRYNYLLFHTLAEVTRIVILFSIFVLAWHSRRWSKSNYLVFVGISYLFVASLELVHALAYKGMGVFPGYDANLPTQLWICFRYLESVSLLLAALLIDRRTSAPVLFAVYLVVTVALAASIFAGKFPDCFVEGKGLTPFKIQSEYVIVGIFIATIVPLAAQRRAFDRDVLLLLVASLVAAAAAEIAFTQYVSVYGPANELGHYLLLVSSYCMYRAILVVGLVNPYALLFRDLAQKESELEVRVEQRTAALTQSEERYRQLNIELEQRVQDRTAKFEAANKELEAFAYSVSHDLRAPLRAINGFSRILLEDYGGRLDAEGQRIVNVVCDSARQMDQLISDILAFSRIQHQELAVAEIDMDELVRSVLQDFGLVTEGRKLKVEVGQLPKARGDAAMIRRVWTNLVDNAIKFTGPKADARIEIGGRIDAGDAVYFVKDNGVGFDMKQADRLFGVFQRLHGAEFAGTGIGLAIIKRILVRHGGRIWADAKVDEGATFYFALPAAGASTEGIARTQTPAFTSSRDVQLR